MKKLTAYLAILSILLLTVSIGIAQEATEEATAEATAEVTANGTVVDVAAENGQLSTLVTAIEAANLTETLTGPGPFTIFAPTNDAFDQAVESLGMTLDELLDDTEQLTRILQYHVVGERLTSAALVDQAATPGESTSLTSFEGSPLILDAGEDGVFINGNPLLNAAGTQVTQADIITSNGVIHIIDTVLLPSDAPSIDDAPVAVAHIRIAHLSPDSPPVEVYLNGMLSDIPALAYPDITGWIEIPADTYDIVIAPFESTVEEAAVGPVQLSFAPGSWTTITTVGLFETGEMISNLVFEDIGTELPDDTARLSFYHAMFDAPAVDVLANGDPIVSNLGFPGSENDGAFTTDMPAGTYDIQIVPANENEPVLADMPDTEVEGGTYYFIAAIGSQENPDVLVESLSRTQIMGESAPDAEATEEPAAEATEEATVEATEEAEAGS